VLWVFADNVQNALAPDDLALGAAFTNGWGYSHDTFSLNSHDNSVRHLTLLICTIIELSDQSLDYTRLC
jgi:hypothetical protein